MVFVFHEGTHWRYVQQEYSYDVLLRKRIISTLDRSPFTTGLTSKQVGKEEKKTPLLLRMRI